MSTIERNVSRLIDEEVEKRVHSRICCYIEKISQIHSIPIRLLRRDMPNPAGFCMGNKSDGSFCTHKAVQDGFCLKHFNKCKKTISAPIVMSGQIIHNHPFPPGFKEGCPACELNNKKNNSIRDLTTLLSNE